VTDNPQQYQNRNRPTPHQYSPGAHQNSNGYDDNRLSESKSEMRPMPLNIDDLPVGKGHGGGGDGKEYEDESNADSRFSSSAGGNRKRSPRGTKPLENEDGEDNEITSAEPHGQDSGVNYGENSSPQNNLIKSRKLRPKDTENYNDFDPFVGGNEPQNPERLDCLDRTLLLY
jgi:hypothetical protein